MQTAEPCYDLAHLGHVEMLTPKPDESLRFFVDVMGMTESGREGATVYLRGWDDYEFHTLKLTARQTPRHRPCRPSAPRARRRWSAAWRRSRRWAPASAGPTATSATARPTRFRDPDGHVFELYYETRLVRSRRRSCARR